jgi:formylglycine-generating enzyme required for sulfatase activity
MTAVAALGLALGTLAGGTARADTFGSGLNQFTIDFVTIGNPGNGDDVAATPHFGGLPYTYRMGVYEVSEDMITKASASGLANVTAGAWSGSQPAANISWYEAAAFVNWLNTNTGHHAAYNLTYSGGWSMSLWSSGEAWQLGGTNLYRHKDAYYFLPSEDEWHKAAYHQNNGATTNYWLYPTGSDSVPDGIDFSGDTAFHAVFHDGHDQGQPNAVTAAGSAASAYGTYGQGGNVWEWCESALDGVNDAGNKYRTLRGGDWNDSALYLRSTSQGNGDPAVGYDLAGCPCRERP